MSPSSPQPADAPNSSATPSNPGSTPTTPPTATATASTSSMRRPRSSRPAPIEQPTRGEWVLAAFVALVLAAIAIGGALVDGSRTFVPGSCEHDAAPWARASNSSAHAASTAIEHESSGVNLAARRFTIEALADGHVPFWNPLLATGEPWLANPRNGVFDPQVWAQAALQRIGGRELADRGYAWFAWLRLACAGFGAYVLARRLGTSAAAAALAAVGFAGSGLLIAHVTAPIGHVVAIVPWVLVALDRLREGPHVRSVAFVALATALLVTGGSPETSFLAGVFALAFAATVLEGRARWLGVGGLALGTLCAAPVLLPFLSALSESAALVARRAAHGARGGFDVLSLGLALVTIAIVVAWRGLVHDDEQSEQAASDARAVARLSRSLPELKRNADELASGNSGAAGREPHRREGASATSHRPTPPWQKTAGVVGVVMALVTCAFVLGERGAGDRGRAWLLVDGSVVPGSDASTTLANFARHGGAWIACVVVALALTSCLSATGPLRARKLLQVAAIASLLLALGTGGVVDAWRFLPLFGLGDTSVAAAVAALCCALLAAEALDACSRTARRTAALVYVALVGLALLARPPEPPRFAPDPDEPYFACTERPPTSWTRHDGVIAGYVTTTLPADSLRWSADRIDADGREIAHAVLGEPLELAAPDASGRRAFRSRSIDAAELEPGTWRFVVALERRGAAGTIETMGTRTVAYSAVARDPRIGPVSMIGTMAAFLIVLFVAGTRSRGAWLAPAAVVVQVLVWTSSIWSTSSAATNFGTSATERFLASAPQRGRVLASPDVLPGDTTLFARLANVQGGDEFALARAVEFRAPLTASARDAEARGAALRRDATRLRDPRAESTAIDPRRVDVRSNAFRLLGVTHVVTLRAIELPEFDPIAGPLAATPTPSPSASTESSASSASNASDRDPATITEAHVYAARDPLPRAFCVGSVVEQHRAMSGPAAFDPRTEAFLEEGRSWSSSRPLEHANVVIEPASVVTAPEPGGTIETDIVRLTADVDGDALLVLTDAYASGWTVTVDGRASDVLLVDGAFRGVALAPGRHTVEFEYAPVSARVGLWLGVLASITLWILMAVPRRYA